MNISGRDRPTGGRLELGLRVGADGRTELASRRQAFPLRMTVPHYLDTQDETMAFIYVQNPTGGLFGGDRLVVKIDAGNETRAHLTTQSATKVYRTDDRGAEQHVDLSVGDGAYLEYVPDTLIPHARSRLEQSLCVRLGRGASFVGTELVAPGRLAGGERFAYTRLKLSTSVRGPADSELCAETMQLEPARRAVSAAGVLGQWAYVGTLIAVTDRPGLSGALAQTMDDVLGEPDGAFAAAGELPYGSGAVARVLAESAPVARRALDEAWAAARQALLGLALPPRRK